MDPWMWWLIAAVVFAGIEVMTLDLVFIMFAAGALAATATAVVTGVWILPFAVFAVVSIGMLLLVRPVALRHLKTPTELRTGIAALEGKKALVLERVDATSGQVKLEGEVWTARPYDETAVYEPGASVDVVEIRGATAYVL